MSLDPNATAPAERPRRRYRRVPVEATVRLSTIDPETDPHTGRPFFRAWEDRCINVSRGGLLLRTHEGVGAGRRVLLELELPDGPVVEAVARIAWTGPPAPGADPIAVGIEFLGGIPDHMARLERYLGPDALEESEGPSRAA
jgi:hypothetical protein